MVAPAFAFLCIVLAQHILSGLLGQIQRTSTNSGGIANDRHEGDIAKELLNVDRVKAKQAITKAKQNTKADGQTTEKHMCKKIY